MTAEDVACWVIKTARPPGELVPDWSPGSSHLLIRCVRASYRLALIEPGRPCLLWLSGRDRPGVHAHGTVAGPAEAGASGPEIALRLTLLAEPVPRADLLADPAARDAEVLRMPAGSNPSWLSARQYAAVLARIGPPGKGSGLGPWAP
ncbi:MAG: hypothetical protein JWR45_1659 [Blastococcus sp.]|jgi:hypothetical protein|nr:hypothetical protein [Blastococcus sp.]